MITLIVLAITILVLAVVVAVVVSVNAMALVIAFGDVIVFGWIVYLIIRHFIKKKNG